MPYFGVPCHAIFWHVMACHIHSVSCHVNIFHEIQKSIVNPEIHRESIVFSTIHFHPGQPGPPPSPDMGAKYVQELGLRFFDMSSASEYMGAKYFQQVGPRFLACHVPNVACHGVSISIVSISSVSCRVRILRVSVSMPCRGHLGMLTTQVSF